MKSAACLSAIYLPVRVLAGNFNKQSSGTHKRLFFLILLIASVAFCSTAKAQQASGMTGVVTDSSGSVVPNAVVVLRNRTIGLRFIQTTNPSGVYRFSQIPPGQGYEAVFSAPSFSPLTVRDIYLTISNIRTQNATLSPGANLEVEVTASSSEVTIDTTDATWQHLRCEASQQPARAAEKRPTCALHNAARSNGHRVGHRRAQRPE